jgi:hypothetical protein
MLRPWELEILNANIPTMTMAFHCELSKAFSAPALKATASFVRIAVSFLHAKSLGHLRI